MHHGQAQDHIQLAVEALGKEGKKSTTTKKVTTPAIIDTGANICMMSKDLFNKLGEPKAVVRTEASCEMADGNHTTVNR